MDSAINLYWGFPATFEARGVENPIGNRDIPADKNSTEYDHLNFNAFCATSYDTLKKKVEIAVGNDLFTPDIIAISEFLRMLYPAELTSFRLESESSPSGKNIELIQHAITAIESRSGNPSKYLKDLYQNWYEQVDELTEMTKNLKKLPRIVMAARGTWHYQFPTDEEKAFHEHEYNYKLHELTKKYKNLSIINDTPTLTPYGRKHDFNSTYLYDSLYVLDEIKDVEGVQRFDMNSYEIAHGKYFNKPQKPGRWKLF